MLVIKLTWVCGNHS